MNLRPYQQTLLSGTRDAFASGSRRVLLASPTGSGKTVTGAALVERFHARASGRILWLAHRAELLKQARSALRVMNPGLILGGYHNPAPNSRVQVASVGTAVRRDLGPFDFVVIDEAHRSNAKSYQKIIDHVAPRFLVGLTATPARTDGKPLGDIYDALLEGPQIHDLVKAGHLAPVRYFAHPVHLEGIRRVAGDFNRKDLAEAMTRSTLVSGIVEQWKRRAAGRSTIAFTSGVAHAEMVAQQFRDAGVRAAPLSGDTPKAERKQLIADLASGAITVLANAEVLIEGVDVPRVSCVIAARPTMSQIIYRQALGRGLRTAPGKIDCILLDHAGWVGRHGHIYESVSWTLDGKDAAKRDEESFSVWTCPECYAIHEGARAPVCPICGWEKPEPKPREVDELDGDLVEVTQASLPKRAPKGWHLARCVEAEEGRGYIGCKWEVLDPPHEGYIVEDSIRAEGKAKERILHLMRAIGHALPADRRLELAAEDLVGQRAYIEVGRYKSRPSITFGGFRRAA